MVVGGNYYSFPSFEDFQDFQGGEERIEGRQEKGDKVGTMEWL